MVWSHNDTWMLTADHGGYVKYWQSNMNNVKMYQAHKDPIRGLRWGSATGIKNRPCHCHCCLTEQFCLSENSCHLAVSLVTLSIVVEYLRILALIETQFCLLFHYCIFMTNWPYFLCTEKLLCLIDVIFWTLDFVFYLERKDIGFVS